MAFCQHHRVAVVIRHHIPVLATSPHPNHFLHHWKPNVLLMQLLSSEDDQQGSLPVTDEPESAHSSTEMLISTAEGDSSVFLERPPQLICLRRPLQELVQCY